MSEELSQFYRREQRMLDRRISIRHWLGVTAFLLGALLLALMLGWNPAGDLGGG